MPNILIIEENLSATTLLTEFLSEMPTDLTILTARDMMTALSTLQNHPVDMFFCSLEMSQDDNPVIEELSRQYPYIPCIATTDDNQLSFPCQGASFILARPFEDQTLLTRIMQLLEERESDIMTTIPTHSLLQMLETEGRTCSVKIYSRNATGYIYLVEGNPISAETEMLSGEVAMLEIIAWDNPIIEILHFNGQREEEIKTPLIALIMESFRLKDERMASSVKFDLEEYDEKTATRKISIVGQGLAVEVGLKMELETDKGSRQFSSKLIGISPENYLIVDYAPTHQLKENNFKIGQKIRVKYLFRDKRCIFVSRLLNFIDSPQELLFLEYPSVIHYLELRQKKRIKIFIPCTINIQGADTEYFGSILDLSSNGGLCKIDQNGTGSLPPLSINERVDLRCLLPGMKEEQQILGSIRNIRQGNKENFVGIEFCDLHTALVESINRFLFQIEHDAN